MAFQKRNPPHFSNLPINFFLFSLTNPDTRNSDGKNINLTMVFHEIRCRVVHVLLIYRQYLHRKPKDDTRCNQIRTLSLSLAFNES